MEQDEKGKWSDVEPKDSNRVFVDVTAYNSKNYFIQGDVAAPGKLPWTANETVLDALNYAGGLIPAPTRRTSAWSGPAAGEAAQESTGRPTRRSSSAERSRRTISSSRATGSSSAETRL